MSILDKEDSSTNKNSKSNKLEDKVWNKQHLEKIYKNIYIVHFNCDNIYNPDNENYDNFSNKISTSKYTWINCIPRILVEQFSKVANIYFLIIGVLQSIDEISISGGKPVILLPLLIVVLLNGIKDFIEDLKRKRSDDNENNKKCYIFDRQKNFFVEKPWKDIQVGDIVRVLDNEEFPADLVMLHSSNADGNCYIETKNLDGETNLKIKQSEAILSHFAMDELKLSSFSGVLHTRLPNENIFEFDASIKLFNKDSEYREHEDFQIYLKSFLLRGCSLKLTKYIYGLVVFTGHKTKIMKNSPNARSKTSRVEDIMNFQIVTIFVFQIFLSIIGSVFYVSWKKMNMEYLSNYIFPDSQKKEKTLIGTLIARIGTWILIFTNFVPISLLLTMEMVKYIQGMFISWDINLFCKETNTPAYVQTSTLNEELGQIQFIFSDKTGTLTKNNMKFRNMAVGNIIYGNEKEKYKQRISDKYGEISNIHFKDENLKKILANKSSPDNENLDMYVKCLALCHSVIVEKDEFKNLEYHASSMDERALVNGARYLNYIYTKKDIHNTLYLEINNQEHKFKLLNTIEFDSKRKRMSVIVRDMNSGKIILFMKGSDSILRTLTTKNREYFKINEEHLIEFSSQGLRNFNIGYRYIDENEYNEWEILYKQAISPLNTDLKLEEVIAKIERDLYLLGTAAIEDELQDDVENTLESFIKNGIKVWMLTGDQKLTAKSIGRSCKMITNEYVIIEVDEDSNSYKIKSKLNEGLTKSFFNDKKLSLIIGTDDLNCVFLNHELKDMFFELSIKMDSVIIFRATPKQKAEVVELIKNRLTNISTLAIGDGANDVNMITSAHVGVGILGEEGKQAARASDYSIAQFSFLKRLLLVHGREAYRKNTFIVCYNFYKNCLFVIPQFWFGIYSLYSGQTLYDPWIYQLYNISFTSLPIIWFGIYDLESDHDFLETSDKHYTQGLIGKLFHSIRFWKWVLTGALQGLILFVFYFFSFNGIDNDGKSQNLWSIGSMIYFGIVLAANLRLFYSTHTHTWISFLLISISVLSYFVILFFMSFFKNFENFNNFLMIICSLKFYYVTLLSIVLIYVVDLGVGKILLLYGCIKDPLKIEKNHVQEFNKQFLHKNQDKYLNEIEIKDEYKKVNDEES